MASGSGILGLGNGLGGSLASAGIAGGASAGIQALISLFGKIGAGRKTANSFVQGYEDVLGKDILPQVVQLRDSGNAQAAQQLLQQGLAAYYQGVQMYQAQGGNFAKVAAQSLSNQALQQTISSISTSLGYTYAAGTGLIGGNTSPTVTGSQPQGTTGTGSGGPGTSSPLSTTSTNGRGPVTPPGSNPMGGGSGSFDPNVAAAQAKLYGLQAPIQQGDPFALNPNGYDPKTLASMNATAMEAPAQAGQQQMGQAKRALAQAGIFNSPAAAGVESNVARQTGYQQNANLQQVQQQNAQVGLQNQQLNWQELNNRYRYAAQALGGSNGPIGG